MGSKLNPGKYDCYHSAEPDEPMFTLLARDPLAPMLVHAWAHLRTLMDESLAVVDEATSCADAMREWMRSRRPEKFTRTPMWLLLAEEAMDSTLGAMLRLRNLPLPPKSARPKPFRPESGSMKFGEDWTGVFIRGKEAMHYERELRELVENNVGHPSLQKLLTLFEFAREGADADVVQLRPFDECLPAGGDAK